MPLYEYQCTACGNIEEAIQKFSDAPLTHCKHCSGTLSKIISQSSFHLKGTGWYVTDYSRKSKASENSNNSEAKAAPAQKSGTSDKESKVETKTS